MFRCRHCTGHVVPGSCAKQGRKGMGAHVPCPTANWRPFYSCTDAVDRGHYPSGGQGEGATLNSNVPLHICHIKYDQQCWVLLTRVGTTQWRLALEEFNLRGLWALGLSSRSEEGLRGPRSASHWGS